MVVAGWQVLLPALIRFKLALGSNKIQRWRQLVKLKDLVSLDNLSTVQVCEAILVVTPPPTVIPKEDQSYLRSPHQTYKFPAVYVAEVRDALIYGGTNLTFVGDKAVCHDLYDFTRDYTSEELHGRHVINPEARSVRLMGDDPTPECLPVAATFLDACAPNYAHWLTEILPRISVFCSLEEFCDVPIVVDDGLHANIMESLALVIGQRRQVFTLPIGRALRAERLYVTSVTGYVPFERRSRWLDGHSHGLFSPFAFDVLRDRLFSCLQDRLPDSLPRKIYLRRSSGLRMVTNADALERALVSMGYVVVDAEKLSFRQQVMLFRHASEIVGPSGAAFANQIFVPKDALVHILIGRYKETSFWYWQNIACSSGLGVTYSLGELQDLSAGIHSNFAVDLSIFNT